MFWWCPLPRGMMWFWRWKQGGRQGRGRPMSWRNPILPAFWRSTKNLKKAFPGVVLSLPRVRCPSIQPHWAASTVRMGTWASVKRADHHPVTRQWAALFWPALSAVVDRSAIRSVCPSYVALFERRHLSSSTHRTFGEMYNLKALADILVRSPASRRAARNRQVAFQMPYTGIARQSVEYLAAVQRYSANRKPKNQVLEVPSLSSNQRRYLLAILTVIEMRAWLATQIDDARRVTMSACQGWRIYE